MYSLRALFAILLIGVSQKLYGEADPCAQVDDGELLFRTVTLSSHPGKTYICNIGPVPVCRGGCATNMKYDVHVDDAVDPKTRCTTDLNQCVAISYNWVEATTLANTCMDATTFLPASEAEGLTVWVRGVYGCSCDPYASAESDCLDFSSFIV